MIKEYKLDDPNVDFRQEMENLLREDLGKAVKGSSQPIGDKKEFAARIPAKTALAPAGPDLQFQDTGLDMQKILAEQHGMEVINLEDYPVVDSKVLRMISPDDARKYRVFPLTFDTETNTLTLAISDPSNVTIVDDLRVSLACNIVPVVAKEQDIVDRINQRYGVGDESLGSLLDAYGGEEEEDVLANESVGLIQITDDPKELQKLPPVRRLADLILLKAVKERASDIHIEPFETLLRIRYRVDGVLREMESPPKDMHVGLISRFKVMANLDIAETRLPQSGRIKLLLPGSRECDLRIESVPTINGESIAMRVLDKAIMQIGIYELGMAQDVLVQFMKQIRKPNGIILVAGPTGCGKTTTLYAAINEVKSPEDKLITTEDPVEYEVDDIVQINVNEGAGLTFARCLRSILRQDPDIILVGEIRDVETAQISIQSALTGHLVFSTLHTNSAAGTITRLIDMGIEPFLITSTLQAAVGQRLVRTICPNCRVAYQPAEEELLDFNMTPADVADITFYRGEGCEECGFTGYKGRQGLFELLPINEEICDIILANATTDDIHALALKQGMISLRQDGWMKVMQGITTLAEVAAHTPREDFSMNEIPEPVLAGPATQAEPAPLAPHRSSGIIPDSEAAKPVDDHSLPGLL